MCVIPPLWESTCHDRLVLTSGDRRRALVQVPGQMISSIAVVMRHSFGHAAMHNLAGAFGKAIIEPAFAASLTGEVD